MAIEGIGNAAYTDLQSLQGLRRDARAQDPQALREAARQFESLFTRMMLQSMRQASMGDSLFDSDQSGFYRDMFDGQLAVDMSRGRGLGLADVLLEQLKRSGALAPAESASASASGDVPGAGAEVVQDSDRRSFIERLQPHAEAAARRLGVSSSTLLAHAALETGWGRSTPKDAAGRDSLNLFGIKATGAWNGPAVGATTTEFEGGVATRRVEPFRAYSSVEQSFADYVSLLQRSPRYAQALGTGSDAAAFGVALQRGGYATDPDYARKLAAVAASVESFLAAPLKGGNELPIPATQAG
jgi:flagellar protein FlgJ